MKFHSIFYAVPLLTNKQKESLTSLTFKPVQSSYLSSKIKWALHKIVKKKVYLSLAILFINASYIQLSTAQTPLTFDYDPGLLPEVAEVLFGLRIKKVNIGRPFAINMSGHYILRFTEDGIDVLDTYTKNKDVYKYQTTNNPNITIGLGVSKGLPRNYKSIVIKEDADGKLYDYAALHSDNITTDETILSETLSHPFYEITGGDGIEDQVTISKAMTFYRKRPSHERHTRCVKSSMNVLKQLMDILSSSSPVCGPEPGIFNASGRTLEEMKLEQNLVEAAAVHKEHRRTVGFTLAFSLNVKVNAVAFLTAAHFCGLSVREMLEKTRVKRAPDCEAWVHRLVDLYMLLDFSVSQIHSVVQAVLARNTASLFPGGQYPEHLKARIAELALLITLHKEDAENVLNTHAEVIADGVFHDPAFSTWSFDLSAPSQCIASSEGASGPSQGASGSSQGASGPSQRGNDSSQGATGSSQCHTIQLEVQEALARARVGYYTLSKKDFQRLPNVVRVLKRVDDNLVEVEDGEYTVEIQYFNNRSIGLFVQFGPLLLEWLDRMDKIFSDPSNQTASRYEEIQLWMGMMTAIKTFLTAPNFNGVIGAVYHNGNLIGISVGELDKKNRVYKTRHEIFVPESIFYEEGAYVGAMAFLTSAVLRKLFKDKKIDSAEADGLTKNASEASLKLGFKQRKRHDEL